MGLVSGKKALVLGVANERSIAFAIAQRLAEEGAQLALTYQGEALAARAHKLAEALQSAVVVPCEVTRDDDIERMFDAVGEQLGGVDFLVHAIAFAGKEALMGQYSDVSREAFKQCMDISVFSFTALAARASKLMSNGGSMLTLTYYGAEKVVRNYNVMGVAKAALEASVRYLAEDFGPQGIRVNAISAGPLKTLSAKGVRDFNSILTQVTERAPLRRNITGHDVAATALFLLSDLSNGVTGEVVHVDSGYNIMGL
jgi:enoyl-[acyl-carrier protein] reductase I